MKTVVVRPERCVGCLQCAAACAVAHSRSQALYGAVAEEPRPSPRIHVGPGPGRFAFPNKCRHCDPAPCLTACMPAALRRDTGGAVLLEASRCIDCGMCAMACPFGVIRYRPDSAAPGRRAIAVKCDDCVGRQQEGKAPACVETCLTGALRFGEVNELLREQSRETARRLSLQLGEVAPERSEPARIALWRALRDATEAQGPE